jgi:branched-chain amino acid transport system substrate-binding protein
MAPRRLFFFQLQHRQGEISMDNRLQRTVRSGLLLACVLCASHTAQAQATHGVSANEILIGSVQDLSGPVVAFSKEVINGLRMRFDEANAAGGVAGRKIRLIVEDSGYDTKKGMMAAQKLVQSDQVFMVMGTMGTAVAVTTIPIFLEAGVIHAFPNAATPLAYDPPSPLKFAHAPPYNGMGRVMMRFLIAARAERKFCSLVQDDDFGQDLMRGVNAEAAAQKANLLERTTYKRGATDFSSQVARLKSAGCDTVLLGTTARETVASLVEARKLGYNPDFISSAAAFSAQVPRLGGEAMEGLMAVGLNLPPDASGPTEGMKKWFAAYKAKFGEEPGQYASGGYASAGWVLKGLEGAGANLTTARFNEAMERLQIPADELGFAPITFTPTKRLGGTEMRIYRIQGGKWLPVSDFISS